MGDTGRHATAGPAVPVTPSGVRRNVVAAPTGALADVVRAAPGRRAIDSYGPSATRRSSRYRSGAWLPLATVQVSWIRMDWPPAVVPASRDVGSTMMVAE